MPTGKLEEPLTDATYLVLLSLLRPRHGYAIMQDVESLTSGEVRVGPATLYTVLGKLVEDRLIARESAPGADERRKTYVATARGREVLRSEVARRERLAVLGRRALAAEEE